MYKLKPIINFLSLILIFDYVSSHEIDDLNNIETSSITNKISSSQEPEKLYLENVIDQIIKDKTLTAPRPALDTCKIENLEMSVKIAECGRVFFNSTSCSGHCKSSSRFIANSNLVKTTCYGCRVTDFDQKTFKVRCIDGSYRTLKIKKIKSCSCFKVFDKIQEE